MAVPKEEAMKLLTDYIKMGQSFEAILKHLHEIRSTSLHEYDCLRTLLRAAIDEIQVDVDREHD